MGRPSKLTPERQEAILGFIRAGVPNLHAAQLAGICESTFYHWLELAKPGEDGEAPDPRYLEFSECVKEGRGRLHQIEPRGDPPRRDRIVGN